MEIAWSAVCLSVCLGFQLLRQSTMSCNNAPSQHKPTNQSPSSSQSPHAPKRGVNHIHHRNKTPSPCTLSDEHNRINVFTNESLRQDQQQNTGIKKILENIHIRPFNQEYPIHADLLCRNLNRSGRLIPIPVDPKMRVKDVLTAYYNSSVNGAYFGKDYTYRRWVNP